MTPGFNGKLLISKSESRRIKNWPGDLSNSLVATVFGREMLPNWWLPAELAVVGEVDLDVRTAAVLLAASLGTILSSANTSPNSAVVVSIKSASIW